MRGKHAFHPSLESIEGRFLTSSLAHSAGAAERQGQVSARARTTLTLNIVNRSNITIKYYLKPSASLPEALHTVNAGATRTHTLTTSNASTAATIRFDSSTAAGFQGKSYTLRYQGPVFCLTEPCPQGTFYNFRVTGSKIDLFKA